MTLFALAEDGSDGCGIADDRILITGRSEAGRILSSSSETQSIAYVVSIGAVTETPPAGFRNVRHRLRLVFEDAVAKQLGGPARHDVESLVAFAREIDLSKGRLLVHCQAGVSRSAAAASIILATTLGSGHETEIAEFLGRLFPHCRPNRLMLALAGEVLNTGDALEKAWRSA